MNIFNFISRKGLETIKSQQEEKKELWNRTQMEWEKISKEKCQELIESMPRRIAAVLKAKGNTLDINFLVFLILKFQVTKLFQ